MSDDLVSRIDDLIVQATKERSHYYTASVLKEARLALTGVRAEIDRLQERVFELEHGVEDQMEEAAYHKQKRDAAESEFSTLRARTSELASENTNLRNDLVQRGMAEEALRARVREVVGPFASTDLLECKDCVDNDGKHYQSQWLADALRAARQLNEDLK